MKDKKAKRLYDASAMLNLLLKTGSRSLPILSEQAILDLTTYELGNSIWQLSYVQNKFTKEEACKLLDTCQKVSSKMKVLDIKEVEGSILEQSYGIGQSFYDSAYLLVAQKYNLELVTDDKKLQRAALKANVKTSSSD